MPLYRTDGSWLPASAVLTQLGAEAGSPQAVEADHYRRAAASWVEGARRDLQTVVITPDATTVTYDPPPEVVLGAAMLAARLYARKGSPTGLASFGEFGPAAVLRLDPDVERLLGVGRYARPVVG